MQFQEEMKNADRQTAKPLIFIRFLFFFSTLCGKEEAFRDCLYIVSGNMLIPSVIACASSWVSFGACVVFMSCRMASFSAAERRLMVA